jgi:LuxR family transcriptional regulator, regulator of acetate metabolism
MSVFLEDIRVDLERAWGMMQASQVDQALSVLGVVERRLDSSALPVATQYRAVTKLLRLVALGPTDRRTPTLVKSAGNGGARSVGTVGHAITIRERDVLIMIGQGCSNKAIARALKISPETVKTHVKRLLSKLCVNTRAAAVSQAMSLGLLQY